MKNVRELVSHPAPGGRPQPLAFHGKTLWVGCWDTSRLYAIDPTTWAILDEVVVPGKPYGIASFGETLQVVIADGGEDDDRYFYRFVPDQRFDIESKTACPDLTGSHLAADGNVLYLGQMHYQRILALDSNRSVLREIALPSRCAGIGFCSGAFYMISADEEFEDLHLATLNIESNHPTLAPVAALPAVARCLAFDGTAWWTSHREKNEIVSFTIG